MHDIEPYFRWREYYIASEDIQSPYHGQQYSEFSFSNKIYNYYIHPQWDEFGSDTLYLKILFVDYEEQYAIIEFIGEWNDCIYNDIKNLKENIVDVLTEQGINKYILCCENVLNFHGSDDCYYEAWYEDIADEGGWICALNGLRHVEEEMRSTGVHAFVLLDPYFTDMNWRIHKPQNVYQLVEAGIMKKLQQPSNR